VADLSDCEEESGFREAAYACVESTGQQSGEVGVVGALRNQISAPRVGYGAGGQPPDVVARKGF